MCSIGVYDNEKQTRQRVLVDLDVFVPLEFSSAKNDSITDTMNYEYFYESLLLISADGHIHLQETLSDKIADKIMHCGKILALKVSICKADIYANCQGVGVETWYFKPTQKTQTIASPPVSD